MNLIHLAEDRDKWSDAMKAGTNIRVPEIREIVLLVCQEGVLHGVRRISRYEGDASEAKKVMRTRPTKKKK